MSYEARLFATRDELAAPAAGLVVGFKVRAPRTRIPPRLSSLEVELDPRIEIDSEGLPRCGLRNLEETSWNEARKICPGAVVGSASLVMRPDLPGQGAFALFRRFIAFNGRHEGRPAILLRAKTRPMELDSSGDPVIVMTIERGTATAPTRLVAAVPSGANGVFESTTPGYGPTIYPSWISAFEITLQRRYRSQSKPRRYVTASCRPVRRHSIGLRVGFEDGSLLRGEQRQFCKQPELEVPPPAGASRRSSFSLLNG